MTAITDKADTVYRDMESPGSSVPHDPEKLGIRQLFGIIDAALASLGVNGAITVKKSTLALLNADLAHVADTLAIVYNDATAANNGIYAKVGGSGSGSWELTDLALPSTFAADLADVIARVEAMEPDVDNNWQSGGAGNGSITGTDNTLAGVSAGQDLTDGSRNVNLGRAAGRENTTGDSNVVIGAAAGLLLTGGDNNAIVGADAHGNGAASVSKATALGSEALYNSTATEAVAVGFKSGQALTTGLRFTAAGTRAGALQTTQNDGTFLGWDAGNNGAHVPGANQTALGSNSYCTLPNQVALGNDDAKSVRLFGSDYIRDGNSGDTFIGEGAGHAVAAGNARVFVGFEAGRTCSTASDIDAVAIGYAACGSATEVRAAVAIGTKAAQFAFNTIDSVVIGDQAGLNMGLLEPAQFVAPGDEAKILFAGPIVDTGDELPEPGLVGSTFVGKNAGRYVTIGPNNTFLGDSAGGFTTKGSANTRVGYVCGEGNVKGDRNTEIGTGVRCFMFSGDDNTVGGHAAGNGIGVFATPVEGGSRNTNFGAESVYYWTGDDTVSLGYRSFFNLTAGAGGDVGLGYRAGHAVTDGGSNVFIGKDSGFGGGQDATVVNSIAIGALTVTTKDNQVVLGNASITETILRGVQRGSTHTVASLTALLTAAAAGAGARSFVTDATATTFASIVAGGGANGVPVYSDGTNWRVG
jgi:hypothetical protein